MSFEFNGNSWSPHPEYEKGFAAGQQSKQTEIDELQKRIDNLQKQAITQGQNFNDLAQKLKDAEYFNQKLQGRIDEAVEYVLESGGVNLTSETALNCILKGNKGV